MNVLKNTKLLSWGLVAMLIIGLTIMITVRLNKPELEVSTKNPAKHVVVPSIDLSNIDLLVYYFVPKDLQSPPISDAKLLNPDTYQVNNWRELIEPALADLQRFYRQQSFGKININYRLYPSPVIGKWASGEEVEYGKQTNELVYSTDTNAGNPQALIAIAKELESRLGREGDLEPMPVSKSSTYQVRLVFYVGSGASSMLYSNTPAYAPVNDHVIEIAASFVPTMLISQYFFQKTGTLEYASTILAHEFGHLIGLRDNYRGNDNTVFSSDIMGLGRFRPLGYTALSLKQKRELNIVFSP